MNKKEKNVDAKRYTYVDFANECIALVQELTVLKFEGTSIRNLENFNSKAKDLLAAEQRRKERALNVEQKKPSKANPEVEEKRQAIVRILGDTPMTTADINLALETNYSPMYVGSLLARTPLVEKVEVIKEVKEFTKNGNEIIKPKPTAAYRLRD